MQKPISEMLYKLSLSQPVCAAPSFPLSRVHNRHTHKRSLVSSHVTQMCTRICCARKTDEVTCEESWTGLWHVAGRKGLLLF